MALKFLIFILSALVLQTGVPLQPFPAPRFSVQARVDYSPGDEPAGFVVTGEPEVGLWVSETPEGPALQFRNGDVALPPVSLGSNRFWLKLEVKAQARFYWSLDGKRWEKVPALFAPGEDARFGTRNLAVSDLRIKPEYIPPEGFVYDEADVPAYTLPPLMVQENGRPVRNVKQWRKRRSQLLSLFEREMYGSAPGRPADERFELLQEDTPALGGRAVRREVKVHLGEGEYLTLLLYRPKEGNRPAPAFLGVNFFGNHTVWNDPGIGLPDSLRYRSDYTLDPRGSQAHRWPLDTILARGYAVATFCCEDLAPDNQWECDKRIKRLYPGYTWGNLAVWAWGLSRAMDYLETCPEIGPVAVFGHSRMGKAALWAAATDERFAMYISDASGCGGAALSRRRYGETLRRINTHFPYWFTPRFHAYSDNEDSLPFDQHQALALIAPRPLYLESASEDRWSDPHGEFLGMALAAPAYALYGLETLTEADEPGVEEPVIKGCTGYHIREGKHQILLYDWLQFLRFADLNL